MTEQEAYAVAMDGVRETTVFYLKKLEGVDPYQQLEVGDKKTKQRCLDLRTPCVG